MITRRNILVGTAARRHRVCRFQVCVSASRFPHLSSATVSGRSRPVLRVADLFHPVDGLAVEPLLDGDVRHRGRRRCPVPVLLAGRKPDAAVELTANDLHEIEDAKFTVQGARYPEELMRMSGR